MTTHEETVVVKLEAVSAMARSLAKDLKNGALWEGDLSRKIGAIQEELNAARLAANWK